MAHPVDLHVGQRIRQRRCMAGMTQQQLGDMVGIRFQQIQKYESGTNRISASRMWDIAAIMDVPVSFFFEGIDGQVPDTGVARGDILTDKEALALVRAYYATPENQRKRLLDLARALSDAA
ncbi:MAG: helix-turn-helix domain-containing protein [Paracoccaceae bacterium]